MLLCLLQALGVALKLTFQGQNQLAYLQFYVFLGVRVCSFCLCSRRCGHYEPVIVQLHGCKQCCTVQSPCHHVSDLAHMPTSDSRLEVLDV